MSARDNLRLALIRDEGSGLIKLGRMLPYWDCCGHGLRECNCTPRFKGKLTLGFGRNIEDVGLRLGEGHANLDNDIDEVIKNLITRYPWIEALDPARQGVLVNMGFMGIGKLAGFKQTLAAIQRGDYEAAAVGMLQSLWAEQVGDRALRLADQMRTGKWV